MLPISPTTAKASMTAMKRQLWGQPKYAIPAGQQIIWCISICDGKNFHNGAIYRDNHLLKRPNTNHGSWASSQEWRLIRDWNPTGARDDWSIVHDYLMHDWWQTFVWPTHFRHSEFDKRRLNRQLRVYASYERLQRRVWVETRRELKS